MSKNTYAEIGQQIGALVEEKQAAYGDSFGKSGAVMRILYPDGITAEKLDDALTVVRVLDKLFRIATHRDALGESPWRDIAGYALLSVKRLEHGGCNARVATPTGFLTCEKVEPHDRHQNGRCFWDETGFIGRQPWEVER